MKRNDILVIIVAYNSMKWVDRCYNSLRESSVPCDVLTIDNGSSDGTQNYIRDNFPEVELIETGSNLGFGKANNIGLQRIIDEGYDYGYLLNQDAWIFPDTLSNLIAASKLNPSFGILSPMQITASLDKFDLNFKYNLYHSSSSVDLFEELFFKKVNVLYPVEFVMAAHWLITRDCVMTVGGFSPTFQQYGEDNNYVDRAHYFKVGIGVVCNSSAIHDRQFRIETKKHRLHIFYTDMLRMLSAPNYKSNYMSLFRRLLSLSVKDKTVKPFFQIFKVLREYQFIKHNKSMSFKETAFLNA